MQELFVIVCSTKLRARLVIDLNSMNISEVSQHHTYRGYARQIQAALLKFSVIAIESGITLTYPRDHIVTLFLLYPAQPVLIMKGARG